jgi:hypothetical protein
MLMAGKGSGIFDLIVFALRGIRLLVSGGASGMVIAGVLGVAVVGGLLWWMGQSGASTEL